MARGKLAVRYIKEIPRLRYEAKLSQREISRCVRVSVGSVNQYLTRAEQAQSTGVESTLEKVTSVPVLTVCPACNGLFEVFHEGRQRPWSRGPYVSGYRPLSWNHVPGRLFLYACLITVGSLISGVLDSQE